MDSNRPLCHSQSFLRRSTEVLDTEMYQGLSDRYFGEAVGFVDHVVGNPNNITNLEGNKQLYENWTSDMMPTLRWASLGYHFQWTPRTYEEEKQSQFPVELRALVQGIIALSQLFTPTRFL